MFKGNNPIIAAISNLLIGSGYLYTGQVVLGLVFLGLTFVVSFLTFGIDILGDWGILGIFLFFLVSFTHSYNLADRNFHNKSIKKIQTHSTGLKMIERGSVFEHKQIQEQGEELLPHMAYHYGGKETLASFVLWKALYMAFYPIWRYWVGPGGDTIALNSDNTLILAKKDNLSSIFPFPNPAINPKISTYNLSRAIDFDTSPIFPKASFLFKSPALWYARSKRSLDSAYIIFSTENIGKDVLEIRVEDSQGLVDYLRESTA